MIPKEIYSHLDRLKKIKSDIDSLKHHSFSNSLEFCFKQLDHESASFDTGERDAIFLPNYDFRKKLEILRGKINQRKFVTAFKTHKRNLSNAVGVYINGLERGMVRLNKEENN